MSVVKRESERPSRSRRRHETWGTRGYTGELDVAFSNSNTILKREERGIMASEASFVMNGISSRG